MDLCRAACAVAALRGGENIYPRELEELLLRDPTVGEVAVVALPDARWDEQVAAFLRAKTGQQLDKSPLIDYIREKLLPRTPRHWYALEAFPLTGSGKMRKFKLRERWVQGKLAEL
ncbi:MAG TPA: hypothetical protein VET87_18465 [Rubrivivax sp.]|nr:hypothetical protein [Rubrivivax sp.]